MISQLKELLNNIVIDIEMDDIPVAMREIARFTVLFDQFLQQNKDYIFLQEVQKINNCLGRMLDYMEQGNLVSLKDEITNSFLGDLDNWDFNNNKPIN